MTDSQIKWMIFAGLLLLFPATFFLLSDLGIWPIFFVCVHFVFPAIANGNFDYGLVFLVQGFIWALLLYFLSNMLARRLASIEDNNKYVYVGIVLSIIVLLALLPIYDVDLISLKIKSSAYFLYKDLF